MKEEIIELDAMLYSPWGKDKVPVEVNWLSRGISFWERHEKEILNTVHNCDIHLLKRGWILTDFEVRHRHKPHIYKLTFTRFFGKKVEELLHAVWLHNQVIESRRRGGQQTTFISPFES
jgi:hypothetical protein